MPACLVLHEGYALALDCLGYDAHRSTLDCQSLLICIKKSLHIVSVTYECLPSECRELIVYRSDLFDSVYHAVDLEIVPVDYCDQVVEAVLGR